MRLKSKGFTLVEFIVIIAILAILAAIVVPRFISAREDSAKNVCYTNRVMIAKAYQLALAKGYSVDLQSFINNPESYGEYYAQKPVCPLGGVYSAVNGKIVCSHEGHNDEVIADNSAKTNFTSNSLILTMQALAILDKKENGIKLNEQLKEALGGSFLAVEDYIVELAFGDDYKGSGLTWRTDTASSTTQIFFAGDGSRDHSNWAAYLVVVDGVLYKTKLTEGNGSIRPAGVAQLYQLAGKDLQERLDRDFEVVGSIDSSY